MLIKLSVLFVDFPKRSFCFCDLTLLSRVRIKFQFIYDSFNVKQKTYLTLNSLIKCVLLLLSEEFLIFILHVHFDLTILFSIIRNVLRS